MRVSPRNLAVTVAARYGLRSMTSDRATARVQLLLATARKNPEFASRLLQEVPEPLRGPLLAELGRPALVAKGPGLRKTKPPPDPYGASNGMTAQLNLFARQVSKVS